MEKNNYKVSVKIEKTIFIEEINSKAEAVQRAIGFVHELLDSGIKPFAKVIAVKTNNIEQDSELEMSSCQIEQIAQTSLDLYNNFNKDELKLLIEDLKFYTGA